MSGPAPRPPRRRGVLVVLFVLAVAFLVVGAAIARRGPFAERPAWSDDASKIDVFAPVWSDRIEVRAPGPAWLRRIGLGATGRRTIVVPVPTLLVRVASEGPALPTPELRGACGCRFGCLRFERTAVDGALREGVATFPTFPRRDAVLASELAVASGDAPPLVARVPNPLPPPPRVGEAAAPLPAKVTAGEVTWLLLVDDDSRLVLVRALDASDRPVPWALREAVFRDGSGNAARRAPEREAAQQKLWLPFSGAYALCVHEPWWELVVAPEGRPPVTFRFRPPSPPPPR